MNNKQAMQLTLHLSKAASALCLRLHHKSNDVILQQVKISKSFNCL